MANFGQKWPKIWSICIFRPREGSRGLNSDFNGKNRIWPKMAKNMVNMHLGPGKGQGVYKVILIANTEFGQIWPKMAENMANMHF